MSVFTPVAPAQLSAWLHSYDIGTLLNLEGVVTGVENTNYFVTTTRGRYVLTLFEILKAAELPFYLNLMAHLGGRGIPCPQPVARIDGGYLGELNARPASIVTLLPGTSIEQVNAEHCALIGRLLANMHLAGASYRPEMPNARGPTWRDAALRRVLPHVDQDAGARLQSEVRFQQEQPRDSLLRGVIHADLFRDNVLWNGVRVGGVIDFYFACTDALLYDVAVAVNDWCVAPDAALEPGRAVALLRSYHQLRPFTAAEHAAWPAMLRAAALRFWLSRLHDFHLPRPGPSIYRKDPGHFRRVLERRIARPCALEELLRP